MATTAAHFGELTAGDEFIHRGTKYRKNDDSSAIVLAKPTGFVPKAKVVHVFNPENPIVRCGGGRSA